MDRLFLCKKNGSDRVAPESSDALTVSEPYIPGRYQKARYNKMNRQQATEQRRQRGESDWQKQFDAHGLSEQFEFIKRDWDSDKGRKIHVRCKSCGVAFLTWGFSEILKGRQTHLLCINCGASSDGNDVWERSPKCDEAMAFYVAGHSVKETAEKFGVSTAQINNSVKVRELTNGRPHGGIPAWFNNQQSEEAEQRLINRLESLGFEYVSGYCDGHIKIRCRQCGDEFKRCVDFAKHGNVVCRKCEHKKAIIRQTERREAQKVESAKRQEAREIEKAMREFQQQIQRDMKLDEVCKCKVCGSKYTPRQYMQSEGLTLFSNVGYCSHECKRRAMNKSAKNSHKGRQDSHRHRARMYGCAYDSSVTLKKLIKRDGLRCAICGEMCDLNDHSWSKYSGPMYPSIDHIIPMSKGGGHIWSNVQVAHIICNSIKSDKAVGE